jgi:uncharacterized membrane protein YdbT with pleckstrin-like domain
MDPNNVQSNPSQNPHPLGDVDFDEHQIADIHKHPFGIFAAYALSTLGILIAFGLMGFVIPSLVTLSSSQSALLLSVALFIVGLVVLGLLLATVIYRQSHILITDKNITQILQKGLFNRQMSQLSFANVEDVTAIKKGIFSTMFNFGTLMIETAGEAENFVFDYCPNPNEYAKQILEARERFIEYEPEAAKRANEHLNI